MRPHCNGAPATQAWAGVATAALPVHTVAAARAAAKTTTLPATRSLLVSTRGPLPALPPAYGHALFGSYQVTDQRASGAVHFAHWLGSTVLCHR
jgi:hypothetical protein